MCAQVITNFQLHTIDFTDEAGCCGMIIVRIRFDLPEMRKFRPPDLSGGIGRLNEIRMSQK